MKTIVGNWKMHLPVRESVALARGVIRHLRGKEQMPEIILCPSFTALSEVHKVLAHSRITLGAQDVAFDRSGPYTGGISVNMLQDIGCQFVIVGHTERRRFFGETNELIARKLETVLDSKLTPIFCVGESFMKGHTEAQKEVLKQIDLLQDIDIARTKKICMSYEPVWSVGTGKPADISDAKEMIDLIRSTVLSRFAISKSQLRVFYGGSITPKNAYQFLREAEIDGVMIGAESIRLPSFEKIIDCAADVIKAQGTSV